MRKHTYTRDEAPTNTGSVTRPARTNLRETCEVHARTLKAFAALREISGMPSDAAIADVWEQKMLPLVEHAIWHIRESPTAVKALVRSMMEPLPREDWVRARYAELKARLEPKPKPVQQPLLPIGIVAEAIAS